MCRSRIWVIPVSLYSQPELGVTYVPGTTGAIVVRSRRSDVSVKPGMTLERAGITENTWG
jgi:hypothetical protein